MEGPSPREILPRLKRNHPDSQLGGQVKKASRTNKRVSENLIVIDSDTEDEAIAGVSLNHRQWIDLTNCSPADVSIIEEKRGRGLTSPMLLGVSTEENEDQSQNRGPKKQVQTDRLRKRRKDKSAIATVDLTIPWHSETVESGLTYRTDPVANTSEVVDLTIIPNEDLEVDLTSSEVEFNNTLLCPVCLDPLFELDVGRYNFHIKSKLFNF